MQIPLQSLPALKDISTATQPDVVQKITVGALNPCVWVVDKVLKQDWPQD